MENLDATDQEILSLLQTNVYEITNEEIGERVGVSSTTVSDRISKLEERGVIESYETVLDYEAAGIHHHFLLFCTVPLADREQMAAETLEKHGVITVREILAGKENLHVEIIGESTTEIAAIIESLERSGIDVNRSEVLKQEYSRPFNGFGPKKSAP
ncbi:Lrp/AsnC family transcriptional regulator [Natrinema versiforme]|uniref:Lrp/AsnC family transcriptional regulator n=1 Tax=Natrinema versiforme TaxID=88724 RepID=A0A4P8WH99_9EURY|nr:Lrp/AsnC family transcriptional regulator [Natrinema versiforme]QCS42690.1 Lrp/AsnC family transcriptional regulator [Natrinema versiforme]